MRKVSVRRNGRKRRKIIEEEDVHVEAGEAEEEEEEAEEQPEEKEVEDENWKKQWKKKKKNRYSGILRCALWF